MRQGSNMIDSGCLVKKLDEKKFNFHKSLCHENIKRNLLNQSVTFIFNHSSFIRHRHRLVLCQNLRKQFQAHLCQKEVDRMGENLVYIPSDNFHKNQEIIF